MILVLARCDAIIITRFELSKIYLLGCNIIHHCTLTSLASIHSEIHWGEKNFLHLPTLPPPSCSPSWLGDISPFTLHRWTGGVAGGGDNGGFTVQTNQMFSVHTALKELENLVLT